MARISFTMYVENVEIENLETIKQTIDSFIAGENAKGGEVYGRDNIQWQE